MFELTKKHSAKKTSNLIERNIAVKKKIQPQKNNFAETIVFYFLSNIEEVGGAGRICSCK